MSKKLKEKYEIVIDYFERKMPVAETELDYNSTYELIVAVILSAQCTDKRVNIITPPFFEQYPDVYSLAEAEVEDIFMFIKSCSYPNNKAKSLLGMAQKVVNDFNGEIPDTIDKLQTLPGVGRKTANVVASVAFDTPAIAVDTHVFRVANRIGLTKNSKNPLETEKVLNKYIPEEKWAIAHHWLILHGRYVCKAKNPDCSKCGLTEACDYYNKSVKTK